MCIHVGIVKFRLNPKKKDAMEKNQGGNTENEKKEKNKE